MTGLAPNTPVLVGVGFHQERHDDPLASAEPFRLMVRAARRAAEDAGSVRLLQEIESVCVAQGMWQYQNPGRLIAEALGCPGAKSVLAGLGVLQLTLLSDLCRAVAAGEVQVGLVTGGEAKYRQLRSQISGQAVSDTRQPEDTPLPDVMLATSDPFCSELEAQRGLMAPVEFFSIIESALRHDEGLGIEAHRDEVARLYAQLSEIAARNPHAWSREAVSAQAIRDPAPRNPLQAFPYTKRHCSQWNVNAAVAILVCAAGKAEALGLPRDGWIFPVSAAESKHVVNLAQKRRLHSHPGTVRAGERALALAGVAAEELSAAELYSCFPAAIRSFARDLRIPDGCPPSVTGCMAFAGGPFNHASLDGVARMVEVLREDGDARRVGLVSNLSGIFGKQAVALFSNRPNPSGYAYEDVTAAVAEIDPPVPLDADYAGPATVVGCTVAYRKGEPSHGIAICDTASGERTVVRTEDPALLARMTTEELVGEKIEVHGDGSFSWGSPKGDAG